MDGFVRLDALSVDLVIRCIVLVLGNPRLGQWKYLYECILLESIWLCSFAPWKWESRPGRHVVLAAFNLENTAFLTAPRFVSTLYENWEIFELRKQQQVKSTRIRGRGG
ncbi:unnamed protein product [Cercospora beticola]|nr:unnamed protein product [Cercospora beticola]